ncbi:MAG: hypothetical protein ACK587_08610 [Cyanobacteriota bacterium]
MPQTITFFKEPHSQAATLWQHDLQLSFQPLASALATEEPSLPAAWNAFRAHLPTMVVLWLVVIMLSGIGFALSHICQMVLGGIFGPSVSADDVKTLIQLLSQLPQMPFALASSLVYVLFFSVPAQYYDRAEVITPEQAFSSLLNAPLRYLLAGVLFNLALTIGFLFCLVPGLLIGFIMPIYVHRIFLTNQPILDAFSSSFQTVFRSANGRSFIATQIYVGLMVFLASICTCGLGALVAVPMSGFYLQNAAYHKGLLR